MSICRVRKRVSGLFIGKVRTCMGSFRWIIFRVSGGAVDGIVNLWREARGLSVCDEEGLGKRGKRA